MSYTAEAVREEMQRRVRDVAALAAADSRKAALDFAARVLKMPASKIKRFFYGEVTNVPAHEADQIRAYCDAATKLIQARADYEAIRRQYLATAHPSLLRFAPGPLPGVGVQEDGAEAPVIPRDPGLPRARR